MHGLTARTEAPSGLAVGAFDDDPGSTEAQATLRRRCTLAVVVGAVAFTVAHSVLAYLRFRLFVYGGRFDLGNMAQAVYNTAHGRFLESTTADFAAEQVSRLGSHVDPILAVFALPWLVWPSPVMLLVTQAAIVSTATWPIYRLGTRLLRDPRAGAVLAGAFLLYPALGFIVLDEFHPVTLAVPFLLFAFVFLDEDRWWAAAPFLVLAALCKEEIPLVLAVLGAYMALRKRTWRPLLLSAAALAYFAFALFVVIPHFNVQGTPFVDRYSGYGETAAEMLVTFATRPDLWLADLVARKNVVYLWRMLWPTLFSPFLSPLTLLIAAPEFALNALSSRASQRSIELHYTAAEIPFIWAAAVLGVARLVRSLRKSRKAVSVLLFPCLMLGATLLSNYLLGPLPFPAPGSGYDRTNYARSSHAMTVEEALQMVPDDVVVSTANNLGSVLSSRRRVLTFPAYEGAEYIVVDQRKPDVFDQWNPSLFQSYARQLAADERYEPVFTEDGVVVLKRVGAAR